jgi:hypothetical protein
VKVQFSGVTLALLGLGALTAAGIWRGSRSRSPDAVAAILEAAHAPRVNLGGDKDGWLLRQKGAQQILFTEDDRGGWCVVRRDLNQPGVLTEVWSGGANGEAAAKEAVRRNGLISIEEGRAAARHGRPTQPQGPVEAMRSKSVLDPQRRKTWRMVFDQRADALEALQQDLGAEMGLLVRPLEHEEDGLDGRVEPQGDGDGWAYIYRAKHPHPGSAEVLEPRGPRGSANDQLREDKKIKSAGQSMGLMPFSEWVQAVAEIKGSPLTQSDPYRPAIEASEGETWYDVWLDRVPPQKAAKLGSRNLR